MNSALPHDRLRVGVKLRPRFMKMVTFHASIGWLVPLIPCVFWRYLSVSHRKQSIHELTTFLAVHSSTWHGHFHRGPHCYERGPGGTNGHEHWVLLRWLHCRILHCFPSMQVMHISFTCHKLNQPSFMLQDPKTITLASYHPPSRHFPDFSAWKPTTARINQGRAPEHRKSKTELKPEGFDLPGCTLTCHLRSRGGSCHDVLPPLQQLEPKRRIHRNWNHRFK